MVAIVKFEPLSYNDYVFPLAGQLFGAALGISSTIFVPLYFLYALITARGVKVSEVSFPLCVSVCIYKPFRTLP